MSSLGLVDHVALGDAICARGWAAPAAFLGTAPAGGQVRAGVDSVMESRLRMLLVLAGLPEPEVNPDVRDEFGHVVRRYDLYYRASHTAVEYDGRHHIDRESQWSRDLARREEAESDGDRVIVLTARDLHRTPARTLEQVAAVLRQRGEPRVPRELRQEWRLHVTGS